MSIIRKKSIGLSPSPYLESRNLSILTNPIYQSTLKTQSRLIKSRKNLSLEKKEALESDQCSKILKSTSKKQFQIRNPAIQNPKRNLYKSKLRKNTQDFEIRIEDIEVLNKISEFNFDVFESIQDIFNDLIRNSDRNKETLSKIKEIYENWIKAAYYKMSENQESEFDQLNAKQKREESKNEELLNQIKILSKENLDLGQEREIISNVFDKHKKSLGANSEPGYQNFCDESKSRLTISSNYYSEQSYEEIKENLESSQKIERTVYKIFNLFMKKKYPIEKILKTIENIDIYERWEYYNENTTLKPFGVIDKLMQTSDSTDLPTFGNLHRLTYNKPKN